MELLIMENHKQKEMRLKILNSQNDRLNKVADISKTKLDYTLYKNEFVKIAIDKLLNEIKTVEDLQNILIEYKRI